MSSKRTHKIDDDVPSKKRHVEKAIVSDENVNTANTSTSVQSRSKVASNDSLSKSLTRSGRIKRIHLYNFMCHENFKVELNKNINVFVGLNGSGKSAILTALAIGLGSKASSTARSTSLKDLVKQGQTSATIEITLANDGYDSFEDERYGKEITIVRHINGTSGASTYKLKGENNRVVSSSRQDLIKLCCYLNIQVENPVLILNQDAARSFLKECDPKKLYQLFLKATQIEAIVSKLHSCIQTSMTSRSQLDQLKRSVNQYEKEITALQAKRQKLQSVKKLREQNVALKNEHDWLEVKQIEEKLTEAEVQLEKTRTQLNKISDIVKNKRKYEKELKEKIRELGTEFTVLNDTLNEKDQFVELCRRNVDKAKNDESEVENSLRNLLDRKSQQDQNIQQLEVDIAERKNNPQNIDNTRKENELKIQQLTKKKGDLTLIMNNCRRDQDQFTETLADHKEKIENAKNQRARDQESLKNITQKQRQLEGSTKDSLSAYGHSMTKLLARLDEMYRKGQFKEMVRGPIGRYIEIKDRKYRSAVENILGGILTSFLVSCDKDRTLLTQVLKSFPEYSRTSIISGAFQKQVYDVRNGMVQVNSGNCRILMDVIKVTDPVVMNCLIDHQHIERVVIVDDTETAIQLTQDEENVPQNLLKVVLLNPFSEFYPAPNYRSYAIKENPVQYIQTSFKDVIEGIEVMKKTTLMKIQQMNEQIKKLEEQTKEKEMLVQDKKKLMSELQQKYRKLNEQLDELNAIEYPPQVEMEFLANELEDLKRKRESIVKKVRECEEMLKQKTQTCSVHNDKLSKAQEEAKAVRVKMTKIQTDVEMSQQQLNEMNVNMAAKSNQLNELKELENHQSQLSNEIRNQFTEASKKPSGERVESELTQEQILHKIRTNEKQVKAIESNKDNIEDINLLLENKLEFAEKMKQTQATLENVLKTLETIRLSRFHYIKRLRQHMSLRCKHKFNLLMGLRNYTGEVEIDHAEQMLELKVIPRDANVTDAVSSTKALSGGERSYTTVSFLLALWSCVDHPFYFLDEYDVFSDEHNRHMMTKLLFNEADKKRDKQFGFLTPQDFSNIEASKTVTIHKLNDPERA